MDGGGYSNDHTEWFWADGSLDRSEEVYRDPDGVYAFTHTVEYGYIDGQVTSRRATTHYPEHVIPTVPVERLETYRYDGQGLLIEEETRQDGQLFYTVSYTHDGEGHMVESYKVYEDGQDDWQTFQEWEEGRLQGWESWNAELGALVMFEDVVYERAAPDLDQEVTGGFGGGEVHRLERYDGERLIERTELEGVWAGTTWQWTHRDDGQVELERQLGPEEVTLVWREYDELGRLLGMERGLDTDGDDGIDELYTEQTWTWTCD